MSIKLIDGSRTGSLIIHVARSRYVTSWSSRCFVSQQSWVLFVSVCFPCGRFCSWDQHRPIVSVCEYVCACTVMRGCMSVRAGIARLPGSVSCVYICRMAGACSSFSRCNLESSLTRTTWVSAYLWATLCNLDFLVCSIIRRQQPDNILPMCVCVWYLIIYIYYV